MTEKNIEKKLRKMFEEYFFEKAVELKNVKGGVSERNIYKIQSKNYVCTGVYNPKLKENIAFIEFSKSFREAGLSVPEIYSFSESGEFYLEEFLGEKSLFNTIINPTITRNQKTELYKEVLKDLIQFQLKGKKAINYKFCYETKSFNRAQIIFDFNKFNSYFTDKLTDISLPADKLKNVLSILLKKLLAEKPNYFMYRDFQPRNIMIKDDDLFYIDYQSGRKGPLYYDVASFLYSGSIKIEEPDRKKLLDYYIKEISNYVKVNPDKFKPAFYYFAYIRLLQVLGSYGFLYEKKKDKAVFIKIEKALKNLESITGFIKEETLKNFAKEISVKGLKSIRTLMHR
jgi:aminoglycoside/choline kinase family phosphotransferase